MNKSTYTGRPWSFGLIAAISAFCITTIGFVVFAVNQDVHLVSENYYEKATKYDERKAMIENGSSSALSWTYDANNTELNITLPESGESTEISVYFRRPSQPDFDRSETTALQSGSSTFNVSDLQTGFWRAEIVWEKNDLSYLKEISFTR